MLIMKDGFVMRNLTNEIHQINQIKEKSHIVV